MWAFADADLARLNGKAVRINITIPVRLLASIDAFAKWCQGQWLESPGRKIGPARIIPDTFSML